MASENEVATRILPAAGGFAKAVPAFSGRQGPPGGPMPPEIRFGRSKKQAGVTEPAPACRISSSMQG